MRLWRIALLLLLLPGLANAAAVKQGTQAWPDAVVPYHFDKTLLDRVGAKGKDCTGWAKWPAASQAAKACRAMDEWHTATGIRFVYSGLRLDSLYIVDSPSATTGTLGHLPLGNRIHLEARASYGSVLHEFGHILGLMHEHQRPDRDQFLTLAPFLQAYLDDCGLSVSAVCLDVRNAFPKVKVQMSSAYDPCSNMHYLANQTPRHREDPRWSRIFTLTAKGQAALDTCLPQLAKQPERCRKVGQKCTLTRDDALIVRRFHGLEDRE